MVPLNHAMMVIMDELSSLCDLVCPLKGHISRFFKTNNISWWFLDVSYGSN